ncbi:MAG TPA: tetratricopeptide repeat protein [Longimicrobiaceae bacterium]|nr:tetratricopeptide repeat protein [Longimicrobiaceae bacterium]
MRAVRAAPLLLPLALAACAGGPPAAAPSAPDGPVEAVSLLGGPLRRPAFDSATRTRLEANLAAARADYEARPDDADRIIWLGRRLAYLGRYREAIEVFSRGIERHPGDARLYRHRGHRYITVRRFDRAIADLRRATELVRGRPDEVEPDGAPNRYNIPTSTLQSNIWYHLGLAHYLRGDFERALEAYREALRVSTNDDMLVATSDWLYMTLRRLGRDAEAARVLEPIRRDMRILENEAYHRRLLMYRGGLPPDSLLGTSGGTDPVTVATQGYGVGNWYLYNGDREQAMEVFRRVVAGSSWGAFGYIAAEAELRRMRAP